jgi:hypothetical protein
VRHRAERAGNFVAVALGPDAAREAIINVRDGLRVARSRFGRRIVGSGVVGGSCRSVRFRVGGSAGDAFLDGARNLFTNDRTHELRLRYGLTR